MYISELKIENFRLFGDSDNRDRLDCRGPASVPHSLLEEKASPPPLVSDSLKLKGDARWQVLYDLAHAAGLEAMNACVPKPLVVENQVYMGGECGGTLIVIVIEDGRTIYLRSYFAMARWGDYHKSLLPINKGVAIIFLTVDPLPAGAGGHTPGSQKPRKADWGAVWWLSIVDYFEHF